MNKSLPTHSLKNKEEFVFVQSLDHKNAYDYTVKHRHQYFEIILIEKGGGNQLIDFSDFPLYHHACYLILPQQIHLLKRSPESRGFVIQFKQELILNSSLLPLLQKLSWNPENQMIFKENPDLFASALKFVASLQEQQKNLKYRHEVLKHSLKSLLYFLMSHLTHHQLVVDDQNEALQFKNLVNKHFQESHLVQFYIDALQTTAKKLATVSKESFGLTPLQVIHERLVLEAKRLILFGEKSHKEICYELGFDNPANFSAFIKNKTGHSPSHLLEALKQIHK